MWNFVVISPGSVGKSRIDPGAKFVISSGPTRASTAVSSRESQMIKLILAMHKLLRRENAWRKGEGNTQCIYSITRLGPNVNNDLASRLKRIEWGLLLNQMLSCTRGNRTSRTTPKLQPRNPMRFLGEGGYAMVCRRTPSYTRSQSRLAMAVTRLSPP